MLPEEVAEPREDSGLKMASLVQPSLLSFCINQNIIREETIT